MEISHTEKKKKGLANTPHVPDVRCWSYITSVWVVKKKKDQIKTNECTLIISRKAVVH